LPGYLFENNGILAHEGDANFLKAGIIYADIVTTVSETYAKELLTFEMSAGMDSYLWKRYNDFYGIVNGVDYKIWNPEIDERLPFHYTVEDLTGKLENKKVLLNKFEIKFDEHSPLIGIISRLVSQKGFDIIADALTELLSLNVQLIVLGSGEDKYEEMFKTTAHYHPHKVGVYTGYNEDLAHLIEAGSDIFLMPSQYEPCGLNQIYSLKYGTVPVVRKTGGLADTVQDWNEYNEYGQDIGNGFSFFEYSAKTLLQAVERAINDFHNKSVWKKIQRNGMMKDYSWKHSAEKYIEVYKKKSFKV
jgi:starch synthase